MKEKGSEIVAKVAIVNVNSFAKRYPQHLKELEDKIGVVKRFIVDENISGKDLAELLQGYEYIILGTTPRVSKLFFDYQKDVKLISRHGIGFNHIDLVSAKQNHVYVTKMTGEIERDSVAEQAISLLCCVSKNLNAADIMVRNKEWKVQRERLMGYQLSKRTTGIIGFGNIGNRFGEIMRNGFLNRILVCDPKISQEAADKAGVELVGMDELLKESDFISLHANLTEENHHMINEDTLSKMKPSAILINTARGDLIDEKALYNALSKNQIAGFGTDVFSSEPVEDCNPLLKCTHTVFSPHVGVYNEVCLYNMDRKVMEDIYLVFKGLNPKEIVN